jgi:hypothetical protein
MPLILPFEILAARLTRSFRDLAFLREGSGIA